MSCAFQKHQEGGHSTASRTHPPSTPARCLAPSHQAREGWVRGEVEAAEMEPGSSQRHVARPGRPSTGLCPPGALVGGAGFGVPVAALSERVQAVAGGQVCPPGTTFLHLWLLLTGREAPREGQWSLFQEWGCLLRQLTHQVPCAHHRWLTTPACLPFALKNAPPPETSGCAPGLAGGAEAGRGGG